MKSSLVSLADRILGWEILRASLEATWQVHAPRKSVSVAWLPQKDSSCLLLLLLSLLPLPLLLVPALLNSSQHTTS